MDIFKLFFKHDQQLEGPEPAEMSLEDFMKPMSTYSSLYLTGTVHQEEGDPIFGLDQLAKYEQILRNLGKDLEFSKITTSNGLFWDLGDAIKKSPMGALMLISSPSNDGASLPQPAQVEGLNLDSNSNVAHKLPQLKELLENGLIALYKQPALHGYDVHLLSSQNIYEQLFHAFQPLVDRQRFRFFSINGKKLQSERHFYFDVWTLHRPPHGAEEVFPETVLYPENEKG